MQFVDLALARRLESITARSGKACAEVTRGLSAATLEIAGGIATFTGIDSPITQAFGIGLDGPVSSRELDQLETFFFSRGAAVALELCPFIDPSLQELLKRRPYRFEEFSNVLLRELADGESWPAPGPPVRTARPDEAAVYTGIVAEGFAEYFAISDTLRAVVESFFQHPRGHCMFATLDGEIAGGGCVAADAGVAELYGAATRPGKRGRGVQTALITARLQWAAAQECSMATTTTQPGSVSQRNFERAGFRVVYSRTKLVRELPVA